MNLLLMRWLKLVEEYYKMVEDSIFNEERALTWAEFERRSSFHANDPFLLADHRALAADFDRYNESFEASRDSYHRAYDALKNYAPLQDHWLSLAKQAHQVDGAREGGRENMRNGKG